MLVILLFPNPTKADRLPQNNPSVPLVEIIQIAPYLVGRKTI